MRVRVSLLSIVGLAATVFLSSAKAQEPGRGGPPPAGQRYSLNQAMSDKAQLNTIAFDGLAFLTGDFAADTFLPPGKVSDYFGFQYMRDIDAGERGHNTSFLTIIANNVFAILTPAQLAQFRALAEAQVADIRRFAEMRLPLMKAFRRNLERDWPAGRTGLDRSAVMAYSAELYDLDGRLAYDRARVSGAIIRSLDDKQRAAFAALKFGDSRTWPILPEPFDRRGMPRDVNVAMMTYASEFYSWLAGSLDADTYFCPERHGMYFGGFGMKTAPAMGKRDYSISTALTGDAGEAFLRVLTPSQRSSVTSVVERQREHLAEIAKVRREISTELRRLRTEDRADLAKVRRLSRRYGELDGEMSYWYANAFAAVGWTLTPGQRTQLAALRDDNPHDPRGPFLYSAPLPNIRVADSDFLFGVTK